MMKKYQLYQMIAIILIIIATIMLDGTWYEPIDSYGNKVSIRYGSSPLGMAEFTEDTLYTLIYKYQNWNGYMTEEDNVAVGKINLAMDVLPVIKAVNMIAMVAILLKFSPVLVFLPGLTYMGFCYLIYSSGTIETIRHMARYWDVVDSGTRLTFSSGKVIALICVFGAAILYSSIYKKLKTNKVEMKMDKEKVEKAKELTKNLAAYTAIKGKEELEKVGDKVKIFIEEKNEKMKETILEKEIAICNSCGHKSVREAKFCSKCGKAMIVVKENEVK